SALRLAGWALPGSEELRAHVGGELLAVGLVIERIDPTPVGKAQDRAGVTRPKGEELDPRPQAIRQGQPDPVHVVRVPPRDSRLLAADRPCGGGDGAASDGVLPV